MSAPDFSANFLALEPILVARLREFLPSTVHVLAAKDLVGISEAVQPTPAVHVLYRGYRRGEPKPALRVELAQIWWTVIAVRNVRDVGAGTDVRAEAGPLITATIAALDRYQPGAGFESLHLDNAPDAGYRAGHGYFPLGWRVDLKVRTRPGSRST